MQQLRKFCKQTVMYSALYALEFQSFIERGSAWVRGNRMLCYLRKFKILLNPTLDPILATRWNVFECLEYKTTLPTTKNLFLETLDLLCNHIIYCFDWLTIFNMGRNRVFDDVDHSSTGF